MRWDDSGTDRVELRCTGMGLGWDGSGLRQSGVDWGRTEMGWNGPGRATAPSPLTQWLAKLRVMTAGAKERAGFMPAPVYGICGEGGGGGCRAPPPPVPRSCHPPLPRRGGRG